MIAYFGGGRRIFGSANSMKMLLKQKPLNEIERCAQAVKKCIRDVEDFPIPGVTFKDLGPLWADPKLSGQAIDAMVQMVEMEQGIPDCVVGIESRGFIFGLAMAQRWNVPFVPFRKPGKLPGELKRVAYALEYGTAELECQVNAIKPGMRVLVHDDVFATGGTARAAMQLVQSCGAELSGCSFILSLDGLNGSEDWPLPRVMKTCLSLVHFE